MEQRTRDMGIFKTIFTWWNGATIGTLWYTMRNGVKIGQDDQGNTYYEARKALPGQPKRRWVMYNGTAEGSRISSDWHGWMHHTFDAPPTEVPFDIKSWEKDHKANLTGTPFATKPSGSLKHATKRSPVGGDYQAWRPE